MTRMTETNAIELAGRDRTSVIVFTAIAVLVLIVDLVVKWLAFEHVPHDGMALIPDVLMLKLTENAGAVFGIGQGGRVFFIGVTVAAIVVIVSIFARSGRRQRVLHVALGLILAGALGNVYDRILNDGMVRDMLYLFPGVNLPFGLAWPGGNREVYPWIFNVADVALVIGVGLIMLTFLRKRKD